MKALLSQVIGTFRASREPRRGNVRRIGPWFGPGQLCGLVLMLENDPTPYVVLRDNQEANYPAGLTRVGDTVDFEVDANHTVGLSTFRNLSLGSSEQGLQEKCSATHVRNDFQALRAALAAAPAGTPIRCVIEMQWRTSGSSPRVESPVACTITVEKHCGIPCGIVFSALDQEFDPRHDIEATYGRPAVGCLNGERCVVVPLSINGVSLVEGTGGAQPQPESEIRMPNIEVKCAPRGLKTEVTGYVDGCEVIVLGNGVDGNDWKVDMISALPASLERAAAYVECMRRTFERAREYGAPASRFGA